MHVRQGSAVPLTASDSHRTNRPAARRLYGMVSALDGMARDIAEPQSRNGVHWNDVVKGWNQTKRGSVGPMGHGSSSRLGVISRQVLPELGDRPPSVKWAPSNPVFS